MIMETWINHVVHLNNSRDISNISLFECSFKLKGLWFPLGSSIQQKLPDIFVGKWLTLLTVYLKYIY